MLFGAVLVQVEDPRLQNDTNYGGKYILEVWCSGNLLFQRVLKMPPRAWGCSRHKNTIIYLLDPEDEQNEQDDIIHLMHLGEACQLDKYDSVTNLLDIIQDVKIKDWTGLCSVAKKSSKSLKFGLDKNNTLYLSTTDALHAITLDHLEGGDSNVSFEAQGPSPLYTFGAGTRRGFLEFGADFCCLWQYDSKASYEREDGRSCLAIFDNEGTADFNYIEAKNDPGNEELLVIKLV